MSDYYYYVMQQLLHDNVTIFAQMKKKLENVQWIIIPLHIGHPERT